MPEDNTIEEAKPQLRGFFTISNMPYEFDQYEVTTIVSELIRLGASTITINRQIVDDSIEPAPEPEAEEVIDLTEQTE